jgi:hypothetical protein
MIRRTVSVLVSGLAILATAQTRKPAATSPAESALGEQLYRNVAFGFRYQIPFGWVDRTKEMRERSAAPLPDSAKADSPKADSPKTGESSSAKTNSTESAGSQGEVLLAIFERPPDAPGDSINSAVVIASESAAAYPGLKRAEDYLGPLTELTTAKGFKADGDPSIAEIDAHRLIRADFVKPMTDKLIMYQSTLSLLAKGRIVSFTFIAGSEDEVDDLMENLKFVVNRAR